MNTQKIKRGVLKSILSPLLTWRPLENPLEGYSIILGVPWALRHLLPVNLEFVQKTDIDQLHRIHIVFDRPEQDGGNEFMAIMRESFPKLPMTFRFHPPVAGKIVERINQSKFYASMNWTLGLSQCETRYAVLHDFDLYPLKPNYFTSMIAALGDRQLRFTGLELTHFDGLNDTHGLIGTWALGIDVAWLRQNFRPIDCFHAVEKINGRYFDLDAFTFIESRTPERALVDVVTAKDAAHVRNLCSTYLRFNKRESVDVVWRLHLMWYLDSLCSHTDRLNQIINLMDAAQSPFLQVEEITVDFAPTHVTCANVLRDELLPMERFLFGQPRPLVLDFADSFERFLWRHGQTNQIVDENGTVRWSPETVTNRPTQGGAPTA